MTVAEVRVARRPAAPVCDLCQQARGSSGSSGRAFRRSESGASPALRLPPGHLRPTCRAALRPRCPPREPPLALRAEFRVSEATDKTRTARPTPISVNYAPVFAL